MIDNEAVMHERVLERDHVVVVVMREARVHPVARLRGFSVADVVGKDDVIARGIEKPAGREEHVGELRPEELMPVAAGAVHDEHGVRHMALGVADGRAQRRVVDADLGHRLAGPEVEIVGEEIAFLGGRFRPRGTCRQ